MKALVAGWFSFEGMGATAGDLMARDVVCGWLDSCGMNHALATAPPFEGGIDWRAASPDEYGLVIFVCGPCTNGPPVDAFFAHFGASRLVGVDVSMLQNLADWNPFDLLLERDSTRAARPDLAFMAETSNVPRVGVALVHPQSEYGPRARHETVNAIIQEFLEQTECARVAIDTRLDSNSTDLRTPAEIDSLIAGMDVLVTTRLHGLVLGIRNGVPPVAVDPIHGGAKALKQAQRIEWPAVLSTEELAAESLARLFAYCLQPEARERAQYCREIAAMEIERSHEEFAAAVERFRRA